MKNFLAIAFLFAFVLVAASANAQTRSISGHVRATDGTALPGVNVLEKGTANGTTTDANGHYTIGVNAGATLVFSFVGMKSQEVSTGDQTIIDVMLREDVISCGPALDIGYGYAQRNEVPGSAVYQTEFNRGTIYNAAQLLQGRVAGLSIYNRGGDPNADATLRIRGLSSFDPEASPLIVIDGVPNASLDNLDPQDVQSVTVLKDASAGAIYGIRASGGVILITTRGGSPGLNVFLQTEGAASTMLKKQPVMNANQYIAAGGNELGSSTDWQEEITRTGITSAHHIAISAASNNSSIRVATHLRSVNGILKESGFDQVNTRVQLRHAVLDGRLRFLFNMALTRRDASFSFPEAFRYAALFNPTAPVRFPGGDYYQAILFDNYNPAAIIGQNVNEGVRKTANFSGRIDFDISDHFTATVSLAQQTQSNLDGRYYSRNSMYVGSARGGLARRYSDESHFTLAESYLSYHQSGENFSLNLVGGYAYQVDQTQSFGVALGNFPNDDLGYHAIKYSADILAGQPNLIDIFSTSTPVNKVAGEFLRGTLSFSDAVVVSASVRRDGSSKLGRDNNTGLFYSAGVNANVLKDKEFLNLSSVNVRLGYGATGGIPSQSGLSLDLYEYSLIGGGTANKVRDANPALKWEQRNETNLGIDVSGGRFFASLDLYQRKQKGVIQERYIDFASGVRYENSADLSGRGVELAMEYYAQASGDLRWSTSLVLSGNRTIVDRYRVDNETRSFIDAPGFGSTQMIRIAEGEKVGQIWGPVFESVNGIGAPVMKDVNGDGVVNANPGTGLDPNTDFTSLGYGLPSWELGWGNTLSLRSWKLSAFFRGAFGHSIVNIPRLVYEPLDAGAINSYNRVRTDKAVAGLFNSQYSSLYVEKADFLKLDNITLEYSFPASRLGFIRSLHLYGTVQNAFVITGYSGPDPEPVVLDRLPATGSDMLPDALAPGIDRNGNYLPARTFTIGLMVGI